MQYFKIITLLAVFFASLDGNANTFESLVMPGEVVAGHKKIETECSSCHELFSSGSQKKLCLDCHKETKSDVISKKGYHGKNKSVRNADCKSCHTDHKGRDADIVKLDAATFNHNMTDFGLKGKHQVVECNSCHIEKKKYRDASGACESCHKDDNPHKNAKASKEVFVKCSTCHDENNWHSIKYDHNKETKFKLVGAHSKAPCHSCHIAEKYLETPKECHSCHKNDDVHNGKNGKDCSKCHDSRKWNKISFDHDKDTSFKLRFKHKKTSCASCHKNVKTTKNKDGMKKARSCFSCHSYDDSHNGRFADKCNECHTEEKWDKAKFKHNVDTDFKIIGKHTDLKCNQCHTVKNKFKNKNPECVFCHKSDDVHKGSLGSKCQSCHTEKGWGEKVKFDHDVTSFPLIGMHGAITCNECHANTDYKKLSKDCYSCHKKNDNHEGRMGEECHACHTPNDWGVWVFDHNKQSKFKLNNAHLKVHCHSCHATRVKRINKIPRDCRDCHSGDDIHNGQFGSRCDNCHTTKNFADIKVK